MLSRGNVPGFYEAVPYMKALPCSIPPDLLDVLNTLPAKMAVCRVVGGFSDLSLAQAKTFELMQS